MNSEKRKTTHVVMSTVCPIPEWCFKLSLSCPSDIRDLTKPRRRWQQERQKTNRFNEQNNNSARASRFFVQFFAVAAQLRREMTKF